MSKESFVTFLPGSGELICGQAMFKVKNMESGSVSPVRKNKPPDCIQSEVPRIVSASEGDRHCTLFPRGFHGRPSIDVFEVLRFSQRFWYIFCFPPLCWLYHLCTRSFETLDWIPSKFSRGRNIVSASEQRLPRSFSWYICASSDLHPDLHQHLTVLWSCWVGWKRNQATAHLILMWFDPHLGCVIELSTWG